MQINTAGLAKAFVRLSSLLTDFANKAESSLDKLPEAYKQQILSGLDVDNKPLPKPKKGKPFYKTGKFANSFIRIAYGVQNKAEYASKLQARANVLGFGSAIQQAYLKLMK